MAVECFKSPLLDGPTNEPSHCSRWSATHILVTKYRELPNFIFILYYKNKVSNSIIACAAASMLTKEHEVRVRKVRMISIRRLVAAAADQTIVSLQ